ncbi:site-specific DNA-methyltransferase [Flavobacterium psychrophilum]|uniref:site-specific DNA-methyltransferase n=3 Tax=Flavobacterium psychrophilum TaxID=96345 RepID=UPI000B7C56F0|nr:site-specific DNA-methyltransferase [Flavobacterium psychrophilum]EKT4548722.1 site-specific DNA-methyltransferase [Flavobacterium psychrophilum]MCB6088182.1 site-specific DNA-methyltransferase [Flavobacterium psychrophilum]MCB6231004.1 site-specific DNA-methyltransferase [Flavobacterium psychrophilum]MEB3379796.1 site-specific DNA-methyltransferase [Flavobacterium psychrophilum]QZK97857.1 site-specific DNA-methyltransferase [Flavobacterium psychrophilum]
MSDKLDMTSPDLVSQNIEKIAALFPNCVTESANGLAIDFDMLKQELSNDIVEGNKERYRLEWPGKREAIVTANLPINKTLRPAREESVDFDNTENLYIEGDNLEVLKLLQESYLGKIKMIYIDPPYNTGKDFVYKDNFTQDTDEYQEEAGLKDEYSNRLVANPDTSGRYHSDWLSMIYPRLKLARNLMMDDGVIFISIGVEEVSNLKKVTDEIFGESNFIEVFSWVKTSTPPALSTKSRKTNEYILCYEKNWNPFKYNGELLDGGDQPLLNSGNSERELTFPKDSVYFNKSKFPNGTYLPSKPDRVELLDTIRIENGYSKTDFRLKGEFKWTQDFLKEELKKGTKFIIKSDILSIRFIRDEEGYKRPTNFIKEKYTNPLINKKENGVGTNENASSELRELMGTDLFSYPKPVTLMTYLANFVVQENDIVLDFFSGSSSTAEGVLKLASTEEKKLKYIMVQLPENLDENLKNADSNTKKLIQNGIDFLDSLGKPHYLSELAKERIRRASIKIKKETKADIDYGFRVYKIDSSNMQDVYYTPNQYEQGQLDLLEDNIKPDRNSDDLVAQIMLDWGLPLSLKIEQTKIANKEVFKVADDALLCCFDEGIDEAFAKEIATLKPLRIVFRDKSFKDDTAKENVKQLLKQLSPDSEMKVI